MSWLCVPDYAEIDKELVPHLLFSILRFPRVWAGSTLPVLLSVGMVYVSYTIQSFLEV